MGLSKKKRAESKAARLAREKAAKESRVQTDAALIEAAHSEPIPCPFCDKLFPGVYGLPGVAMLRADNETLICSDCGTREALEGGLKMPVSKFLEGYDSHGIYDSDKVAAKLLAWTGVKAPWTPVKARTIRQQLRSDPRGGTVTGPDDASCVAGYNMAAALAWDMARFHSVKMGRGFLFRDCIEALRGNGY